MAHPPLRGGVVFANPLPLRAEGSLLKSLEEAAIPYGVFLYVVLETVRLRSLQALRAPAEPHNRLTAFAVIKALGREGASRIAPRRLLPGERLERSIGS
jgi:hypothetical protein